jgi:hypothetical protein
VAVLGRLPPGSGGAQVLLHAPVSGALQGSGGDEAAPRRRQGACPGASGQQQEGGGQQDHAGGQEPRKEAAGVGLGLFGGLRMHGFLPGQDRPAQARLQRGGT